MSDIGREAHLRPSAAQLPVAAYFDEDLHRQEIERLFKNGPGYRGHELMVPEVGDYYALPAERGGRILVRDGPTDHGSIRLLSNVCRHRQAIMLQGQGNTDAIVCPLHRWTYDRLGSLVGAPHFPENPCLNLAFRLAAITHDDSSASTELALFKPGEKRGKFGFNRLLYQLACTLVQ